MSKDKRNRRRLLRSWPYLRRLAVLACIGALHVLLLWWGDILWGYAVAGAGLILFRGVRGWKLLAWALALALLPPLLASIPALTRAILRLLRRLDFKIPLSLFHALSAPAELGMMLLCCGYAAVVVLLMQRPAPRRVLLLIAPVGQLALTTYLVQSLTCTFLFYGWGLGLAPRVVPDPARPRPGTQVTVEAMRLTSMNVAASPLGMQNSLLPSLLQPAAWVKAILPVGQVPAWSALAAPSVASVL